VVAGTGERVCADVGRVGRVGERLFREYGPRDAGRGVASRSGDRLSGVAGLRFGVGRQERRLSGVGEKVATGLRCHA